MAYSEEVVREFDKIGKYRVRLVKTSRGESLDIREYVSTEKFEGFTRKGIRLNPDMYPQVLAILKDLLIDQKELPQG